MAEQYTIDEGGNVIPAEDWSWEDDSMYGDSADAGSGGDVGAETGQAWTGSETDGQSDPSPGTGTTTTEPPTGSKPTIDWSGLWTVAEGVISAGVGIAGAAATSKNANTAATNAATSQTNAATSAAESTAKTANQTELTNIAKADLALKALFQDFTIKKDVQELNLKREDQRMKQATTADDLMNSGQKRSQSAITFSQQQADRRKKEAWGKALTKGIAMGLMRKPANTNLPAITTPAA